MTEIPHVELRALASPGGLVGGPFGSSLGGRDYVSAGVPVIRGANLNGGRYVEGDYAYVSTDKAHGELSRNLASPGDLIFTQRGTLGQVGLVPEVGPREYVVSQSQMRLRVDARKVDSMYLYYACSDLTFLKQIEDNAISTGVPHINLGILSRLTVPLPRISTQRAIADVLGALDDKIAANNKLVSIADRLASALFASMPIGDVHVPLSSVAQFVNGRAFTKGASGTGRVVIRIAELNSGLTGSTVYSDATVPVQHVAGPGDILFAWSGSLTLHRWYRPDAIVNQHIFKVIPNEGRPAWLVWELIAAKLDQFRAIAADKATTMGHIQRRHLDEPVAVPPREAIERHDSWMTALWERALAAERESLTLAATRDALLPALMNGTLRVRDAERTVEAIAWSA